MCLYNCVISLNDLPNANALEQVKYRIEILQTPFPFLLFVMLHNGIGQVMVIGLTPLLSFCLFVAYMQSLAIVTPLAPRLRCNAHNMH